MTPRRRLLPALVLLAGAAALVAGLVALQRIFLIERRVALASLESRRSALEQYAQQAFAEALASRLSVVEPQIDSARRDPLVAARGLLLVENGRILLPPRPAPLPGSGAPARRLHEALRTGRLPTAPDASPLAERIALYRDLQIALMRCDRSGIEETFRRFLGHRMLYVLPAAEDLALAAAAFEALVERSTPRAELLRGLLRDGLADGRGGTMEGLQRSVLARRARLTSEDFRYLAGRLADLSQKTGVLHDDFVARSEETTGPEIAIPVGLREPALLDGGRWYVEPRADASFHGVVVNTGPLLAEVTREMRLRALLPPDGHLELTPSGTLPLSRCRIRVESDAFGREADAAVRNQRVKAGWAVLCGLLSTLMVGLAILWVRQEKRYVDLKADFVATVSHELRTPLASVRLLAETLERRLGAEPEARDYPSRIVREADRLGFLVDNILSFNRISRGKVRPHLSDVNLGEALDAVHRDRGEGRDVVLLEKDLDAAWLRGDPELVHLLLSNLYENACRYTSRRPVSISVSRVDDPRGVSVLFADNGDGIPTGEEECVFQEFHRSRVGGEPSRRGSGLGLAICRRIMALHRGTIRVVKSGPEGTTFEMTFPRS